MKNYIIIFTISLLLHGLKESALAANHSDNPEKFWNRPINMSATTKSRLGDDVETLKKYWGAGYSPVTATTKHFGLNCALMHLLDTNNMAEFLKAVGDDPRFTKDVEEFNWEHSGQFLFHCAKATFKVIDHSTFPQDIKEAIAWIKEFPHLPSEDMDIAVLFTPGVGLGPGAPRGEGAAAGAGACASPPGTSSVASLDVGTMYDGLPAEKKKVTRPQFIEVFNWIKSQTFSGIDFTGYPKAQGLLNDLRGRHQVIAIACLEDPALNSLIVQNRSTGGIPSRDVMFTTHITQLEALLDRPLQIF